MIILSRKNNLTKCFAYYLQDVFFIIIIIIKNLVLLLYMYALCIFLINESCELIICTYN